MRLAGHIAHLGNLINLYKMLVRNHGEKQPLGHLGIDWKMILKWILKK